MQPDLAILIIESMVVYFLVLWTHALRRVAGLAYFYALLGGLTAIMSWLTDAGALVQVGDITFMVGSTVFYTALLLGVFVVYVFDGPRATRIAISTVAGVSIMVPVVAAVLHAQMRLAGHATISLVPEPSLRVNSASVVATIADLVFLGMAWELLGKRWLRVPLWLRSFLTLLGVMWLDVLLFATGAFAGTPAYAGILQGTLLSRFVVAACASPLVLLYVNWQNRRLGVPIESRPVLAILTEVAAVRAELSLAQQEIVRRKAAEAAKEALIHELEATLARVQKLEGLLPVCASCRRIRVDPTTPGGKPEWISLESYVKRSTTVRFSHGICGECMPRLYPEYTDAIAEEAAREARQQSDGARGSP